MKPALVVLAALALQDVDASVHPRNFGSPGGIGVTRGWYVWRSWNPQTATAEVSQEKSGETFSVRVLPWMTTYRHLAYGASPDDLLPGERVNLFFNPKGDVKRAYLVHYQDEIGQMKGHGHAWQLDEVSPRGFVARVMNGEKVFDPNPGTFELDPGCAIWRSGKKSEDPALAKGEKLFLTWRYDGARRVVKVIADAASLDALQRESEQRVRERLTREGMGAFVESTRQILIFSTWWAQANSLKTGQKLTLKVGDAAVDVRVVSRKNLGAYGSGPNEIQVDEPTSAQAETLRKWTGGTIVRVFAGE